jgi:hypothetical protein
MEVSKEGQILSMIVEQSQMHNAVCRRYVAASIGI